MWLVDDARQVLTCAARHVSGGPRIGAFGVDRLGFGVGLPGRVLATGTPRWIPDLSADTTSARSRAAARAGLRVAVGVPVHTSGHTFGALCVHGDRAEDPEDTLIALLAGIAAQVGQYTERRRAEELAVELARTNRPTRHRRHERSAQPPVHGDRAVARRRGERPHTAGRLQLALPSAGVWVVEDTAADGAVTWTVTGELTFTTGDTARTALTALLDRCPAPMVGLNLSGLHFCDRTGLQVLLQVAARAAATGRAVRVVAASTEVDCLLTLTRTAPSLGYLSGAGTTARVAWHRPASLAANCRVSHGAVR